MAKNPTQAPDRQPEPDSSFRGDRLKWAREKMGLTQPELEKLLDLGKGAVSRYENNVSAPTADSLKRIAAYLEISSDYLLGLSTKPEPDDSFKGKNWATPRNAKEAKFLERLRKGEVLELIHELSGDILVSRNGEQKPPKDKPE